MISYEVKYAAQALDYPSCGMPIQRMDTHSLRAGGGCAMKLAGKDDVGIQRMGRWAPESTSFLEHIQQQLSTFSKGMTRGMSRIAKFMNMEGTVTRDDMRHLTIY